MVSLARQQPGRVVVEFEPDGGWRVGYELAVQLVHDRQRDVVVDEVDEAVAGSLAGELVFNNLQFTDL